MQDVIIAISLFFLCHPERSEGPMHLEAGSKSALSHSRDSLPPNLHIISKPSEPRHIRLAAEPRHLPLGVVAMALLRGAQGRISAQLTSQQLHRLLITQRCQRPSR